MPFLCSLPPCSPLFSFFFFPSCGQMLSQLLSIENWTFFQPYNSAVPHSKDEDRYLYAIRLLHMVLCPFPCFNPCWSPRKERSEQSNRIQGISKCFFLVEFYIVIAQLIMSLDFAKVTFLHARLRLKAILSITESYFKDSSGVSLGFIYSNKSTIHICLRKRTIIMNQNKLPLSVPFIS